MTEYRRTNPRRHDLKTAVNDWLAACSDSVDRSGLPGIQVRGYDGDSRGGTKHWSQAPWHDRSRPDPRGFKHHDKDGIPMTTSRREVDEVIAKTQDSHTPLRWEKDS